MTPEPAVTAVAADRLVRRPPFSDNPVVGPRGQRTQQRILDAALRVFGDEGYYGASIDRITRRAGCSRASFYQYFAGKDDVFQQLAAQLARQVIAATDSLDQLTPGAAGRDALRVWIGRYAEIYERSVSVFRVFDSAAEHDAAVSVMRATAGELAVTRIQSKLAVSDLPPRELDAVVTVLVDCVGRTLHFAGILRTALPEVYPRDRVLAALTDVLHRTLFGRVPEVNEHPPGQPAPRLSFTSSMRTWLGEPEVAAEHAEGAATTVEALLSAGREAFSRRGFAATRVDDVVSAAGLSHGAFYRYFPNLASFARVLVRQAMQPISAAFATIPTMDGDDASYRSRLRQWLRRYNTTHSHQAAMIRVWLDASLHEPEFGLDSAAALDWGRQRMATFLEPRNFGDVTAEAVVMVALLDAFGAHARTAAVIDAVAHVIERGLLGLPG